MSCTIIRKLVKPRKLQVIVEIVIIVSLIPLYNNLQHRPLFHKQMIKKSPARFSLSNSPLEAAHGV